MWGLDTIILRPDVLIYVVNLAVVASLVCGLNLLAARVCRKCSAPFRYSILASGLGLTLLCPAAAWFGQYHGPGFVGVRVAGRPSSVGNVMVGNVTIGQSKSDSTTHDTTIRPVEYSAPKPFLLDLPTEPTIRSDTQSVEPLGGEYSLQPAFHSNQTRSLAGSPVGTLDAADRTTAQIQAGDNRFTPVWWQLGGTLVVYAWGLGAVIGVFRLARGYRSVIGLRRSLKPIPDARIPVIAREVASALGLPKPPPILTSDQIPVPISLGVWRPVVILPQDTAREMEKTQLTAVLLHEMAHIARRDHLTGLAQRLALILFWWNSLVRRLSRRISELREEICDNHVLQVQGEGASLARVLIDMADRAVVGPRLPVAVGMNGPELNGLGKRISRLVNKEPNMATRMNRVGSSLIFLCGLTVLLGIACAASLQAFEQDAAELAPPEQSENGYGGAEGVSSGLFGAFDEDGNAGMVAGDASPDKRQAPKRRAKGRLSAETDLKAVYQFDFRGSKFDRGRLMPFGFKSLYGLQLLKPEPKGLRVIIPHHQGREKPLVGLIPLLTVQGDFEITASCELLTGEAPEGNLVAGADLYILAEKTLNGAVLRLGVNSSGEHVYFVYHTLRDDDGKPRSKFVCFPAQERAAKLRLARKGTKLQFLVAREDSEKFRKLHEIEFGDQNLGLVRLETSTEGSPIGVEALWKDLTIRAGELESANVPLFRAGMFDSAGTTPRIYVEPAAPIAQRPGLRIFEPFEGDLTLDWKPVRPDPTHVSLTENPGKLTITTQAGGIWENTGHEAKNLYLVRNPMADGGDFVLTTCIESFQPAVKWQQAGLLVYDDDDNYLKCAMQAGDGSPRLALVRESDGDAQSDIDQTGVETEKLWIRIIKRGKSYERAYSIDGRKFVSAGEADWGDGAPQRIGIFAKNGTGQEPEVDAAFDFFEVRSLTPAEKVHKSL